MACCPKEKLCYPNRKFQILILHFAFLTLGEPLKLFKVSGPSVETCPFQLMRLLQVSIEINYKEVICYIPCKYWYHK